MKLLKTGLLIMFMLLVADASLYLTTRLAVADGIFDAVEKIQRMSQPQHEEITMPEMVIGPVTILEQM